jgi:hypothetical protein
MPVFMPSFIIFHSEGTLKTFLAEYRDIGYVVSQLPDPMSNDTTLPSCISCGPVADHILEGRHERTHGGYV